MIRTPGYCDLILYVHRIGIGVLGTRSDLIMSYRVFSFFSARVGLESFRYTMRMLILYSCDMLILVLLLYLPGIYLYSLRILSIDRSIVSTGSILIILLFDGAYTKRKYRRTRYDINKYRFSFIVCRICIEHDRSISISITSSLPLPPT